MTTEGSLPPRAPGSGTQASAQVVSSDTRAMLDSTVASPDAICVSTLDGGWLMYANKRWLEVVGYTRRRWRGWPLNELDYWADRSARDRLVQTLRDTGVVGEAHITYRTCSGAQRHTLAYVERMTIDRHDCMCVVLLWW